MLHQLSQLALERSQWETASKFANDYLQHKNFIRDHGI
jgi:hypothetical protein